MYEFSSALVHSTIASTITPFDAADLDDAKWFIGVASEVIAKECRRTFVRPAADVTEYYNAPKDAKLTFRNWPVHTVTRLRYDPDRAFDDSDDDIDSTDYELFEDDGVLYLPYVYALKRRVFQLVYTFGYSVPKFMQATEPTALLSTPGDIWSDGTTIKKYSATLSWDAYDTEIVPEKLMQATIAYAIYLKKKLRAKEIGVKQKERGYAFEGSSVKYELGIPEEIKKMYESFISLR